MSITTTPIQYKESNNHHELMTKDDWQKKAKGLIKAEIARRGLSNVEVVERLKTIGVHESQQSLSNKINRGGYSAVFLLQVMTAIGCDEIKI